MAEIDRIERLTLLRCYHGFQDRSGSRPRQSPYLVEDEGFEPSDPISRIDGLANRCHQPLGQSSLEKAKNSKIRCTPNVRDSGMLMAPNHGVEP